MAVVDENRLAQRVVIPDHALHPVSEKIDQVRAGLYDECHRRRRGLMQEIRVMADREFLILNMPEQRLNFLHPDGIGPSRRLGLLEIPLERVFLDPQNIQPPAELAASRLADFPDILFEFLKLGFCFQNFIRKQRRIFTGGFHGAWWIFIPPRKLLVAAIPRKGIFHASR